jgi:hypothetical protein
LISRIEVDDALAIAEQAVYLFLVTLSNLVNRGIAMTADITSRNTPDRMDLPVGREPRLTGLLDNARNSISLNVNEI